MKNNSLFEKYKKIHFVGIGGIGMSALAKLCFSNGIRVSGSDRTKSDITDELEHIGIQIHIGHNKKNVQNADIVVYTCAISDDNPEILFAKKTNIPIIERAEFLGKICESFDNVIAVAGSHGKTTVSAMIGSVFLNAKKSPTMIVGGQINGLGNLVIGKDDYLIVEACEYKAHFLSINPTTAVILNVDYDHPDFYKSQTQYANAFAQFSKNAKQVVISEKCKMLADKNCTTFGVYGNYFAKNIKICNGKSNFDVYKDDKFFVDITLKSYANYNIENALCAVAVCDLYKIAVKDIKLGLENFDGVQRRYEFMGKIKNNVVITDYAHHPTQIADCILATKKAYKKKVVAVFEPHTYSRTKSLFSDFVNSLCLADNVVILPTYSAREKRIKGGTAKDLFNAIRFRKNGVCYKPSYKSCKSFLAEFDNCVILLLGAGSIINLAKSIKSDYIQNNKNIQI